MQAAQTSAELAQPNRANLQAAVWWLAAIALTFAVLVLRRPDAVLNPQFYADDGHTWFQQAYNEGAARSLFHIYGGYFQVLSRLAAVSALGVPLLRAPLVMNLMALLVEALPPLFLLSPRMRNIGRLALRGLLALLYLTVPKAPDVHANITNAPLNLALLAFLVVIAEPPASLAGRIFDVVLLTLMALTGPACILLFPVTLLVAAKRRQGWTLVLLSIVGSGSIVQGVALLMTGERLHQTLGASFPRFCRIVAGQVVLPVVQGRNRLDQLAHSPAGALVPACLITALTAMLLLYALWRGSLELRSFILFASLLLAAALAFPTPNATSDHWGPMMAPGGAGRYWYIPGLALMAILLWLLGRQRPAALRLVGAILLSCMIYGATKHWRFASFPDLHFPDYAQQFERLPPGSSIEIPLNPPGWSMTLTKK